MTLSCLRTAKRRKEDENREKTAHRYAFGAFHCFCRRMRQNGKTNAALPEVRNSGTAVQWKYSDEADWRDLVALTELRVLPEKTARTELTAPTERTASTVKTVLTAKTALTVLTAKTALTAKTEQTAKTA